MAYAYPTQKTGTSQDLLTIITRAYERHIEATHIELPEKTPAQRRWLEPPFILIGIALSKVLEVAPWACVVGFHDKLFSALASPKRYPFDASSAVLARAAKLAASCAKPPALLALVSHPPVMGDMAHLNFELVRHATLGLAAVRGGKSRPRLLVAVDPFALDTIPVWQEGLYAGFMGTYHLGFDRLSLARNRVSRALIGPAGWDRLPHRLIRLLSSGGEAGMVLAGGVPATTRSLYAVREWTARARRASPDRGDAAKVIARIRVLPGFADFERDGPHGAGLGKSAARLAELWAMAVLSGSGAGEDCSATGRLTEAARGSLDALLGALGHADAARRRRLLDELAGELARETPYRERFFSTVVARALRRRALVLLPIAHRIEGGLGVEAREAWLLERKSDTGSPDHFSAKRGDGRTWSGPASQFAQLFGRDNFQ